MQTFLPYQSFTKSARVLDNKRLGKQRVECLQIFHTLRMGPYQQLSGTKWVSLSTERYQPFDHNHRKTPWYNHPAVKMWKGYECQLVEYTWSICFEWTKRGFKDTVLEKVRKIHFTDGAQHNANYAPWLYSVQFHASHRSNLLRKDPKHYGQFGWTEPNNLPYIWPV